MTSKLLISIFDSIPLWVMVTPIILCSIILMGIVIERVIFYKKIDILYRKIIRQVLDEIRSHNKTGIKSIIEAYSGPLVELIAYIAENWDDLDNKGLLIRDEAERTVKKIEKYGGVISTIATVSPMLGLLGTVTGMMKSFGQLKEVGPQARDVLSQGITEALITTALGLMVAIPAIVFYNYMVSKMEHFVREVEFIANSLHEEKSKTSE